jgi:hypothetical protein
MLAFFTSRAQSFYNSFDKRSIITTAGSVKKFKNTQFYSADNYGAENYSGIAGRVEVLQKPRYFDITLFYRELVRTYQYLVNGWRNLSAQHTSSI